MVVAQVVTEEDATSVFGHADTLYIVVSTYRFNVYTIPKQ